jgi:HK97 family phage prohead protease
MTKRQAAISIARFHDLAAGKTKPPASSVIRLALVSEPTTASIGRTASFVFSDTSVDSYGDTIDVRGWDLRAFESNPVVLFGHDPSKPENVIGKATNVRTEGNRLVGDIEFAEAAVNPAAETIYQMVKGGYLNAVSVGFQPQEWRKSNDKNRPGGIDFLRQKLLEVSIVAIPANENALVQAKAAGLDVDRLDLAIARDASKITKKGLYSVANLAGLLFELGWLQDIVAWEADYEGDGSEIPARLVEALKVLGQILVDMTAEEVAEMMADIGASDDEVEIVELDAATPAQKALFVIAKALRAPVERAGKAISSVNEKIIRDGLTSIGGACEAILGIVDSPDDDPIETASADNEMAKAIRARKARALKLQHTLADAAA